LTESSALLWPNKPVPVLAPNLTLEPPAQQAEDVLSVARSKGFDRNSRFARMDSRGWLSPRKLQEAASSRWMWKTGGNPVILNRLTCMQQDQ
jgi:hypothetical protein